MNFLDVILSENFMPRGRCGMWNSTLLILYQWSNLAITLAYIAIPIALIAGYMDRREGEMNQHEKNVFRTTFSLFVLCCGIGHIEHFISFRVAIYHVWSIWHFITAVVSWAAVGVIWRLRVKIVTGL